MTWVPISPWLETGQGYEPCKVTGTAYRNCEHCQRPLGMWCDTCEYVKRGFGKHVCVTHITWIPHFWERSFAGDDLFDDKYDHVG